jgi:hypothetical protein
MDDIHNAIVWGIEESDTTAMLPDSDTDSDSGDEFGEVKPVIKSMFGLKYSDHLGRLAVNLHCFFSGLVQTLALHKQRCEIPREIPRDTLLGAKNLLDHLVQEQFQFCEVSFMDLKNKIGVKRMLETNCTETHTQATSFASVQEFCWNVDGF